MLWRLDNKAAGSFVHLQNMVFSNATGQPQFYHRKEIKTLKCNKV